MTMFRSALVVLFCSAIAVRPAAAADIILDGEAACASLGGWWSSEGDACAVKHLTVPADMRLLIPVGVTLATGDLVIDGYLEIRGGFEPTGELLNRGTFVTRAFIVSQAQVLNRGSWLNEATFLSDQTVENDWYFENRGTFQVRSGAFINVMLTAIDPGGQIWNSGGRMVNEGYVTNAGYLYNPPGATIDNAGVITTYDATFFNYGRTLGQCGSASYVRFPGILVGNPIELAPCTAADAVGALADYVFKLAKERLLDKHDGVDWRNLLKKSAKRLEKGEQAEGLALLQAFIRDVPAKTGPPVREVLLARGYRALEIVTTP